MENIRSGKTMSEEKKRTIIPVGPFHPLQEEPEFFELSVEGEKVVDININLGYNHRGIEKLSEGKHYDQVPFLVERICGICSTSHPMAYCQAVEDITGVEIPLRAKYIRSIVGELERLHSHFLWVGLAGHFLGYNTVWMWAWKYRETVNDIMERLTGNRQHYAMIKPGGVRRDFEDEDIDWALKMVCTLVKPIDMFKGAVLDDPVIHARTKGVGILTKEDAHRYGAVGPTARASGVPFDIRKNHPHAAYNLVKWNVVVCNNGDVFDKAVVRILEMYESIKIVKQCFEMLKKEKGEIDANLKEIPVGEGIGQYEAPRGEVFHYVKSDGSNRPIRHKIRAPSYVNVPTAKSTVIGETVTDATLILASVDPCYCCTERIIVIDAGTRKRLMTGRDLVRLSQEKTRELAGRRTG